MNGRGFFAHLEGEAKDEIRYMPQAECENPEGILAILQELYGCSKSYISLQEDFFHESIWREHHYKNILVLYIVLWRK